MEIKDVNNQNSVLTMFRKMTEAAGTFEFASLIGGNEQSLASSSKQVIPSMDKKLPQTTEVADKAVSRRENKPIADKSEAKPLKENKRKDKNVAEETSVPVTQEQTPFKENKSAEVVEKTVSSETAKTTDVATESVVEPMTEANRTVIPDNVAVAAPVIADLMSEVSLEIAPLSDNTITEIADNLSSVVETVSMDNVAALGEIKYFDAVSGTVVTTTGSELVQAVEQKQINDFNPANITTLDNDPVFPHLVDVASLQNNVSQDGIDISTMEAVIPQVIEDEGEVVVNPDVEVADNVEIEEVVSEFQVKSSNKTSGTIVSDTDIAPEIEDNMIAVSAEEEIVINDKKVKLDVKITPQEEKISYLSRQEMFTDNLAVNEAVAKAANIEAETTNSPINVGASQNSPISTAPSANILPQGVAIQAQVENITSVTSGAAVSSVDSTSNLTSASLNNTLAAQTKTTTPAAELKSPAEDALKGMGKEVIEQVKVNITKSAVKGVDKIDISLKPEDLGHIEVKMQLSKDGKLHAHIISSRMETMEILQKDMQSLQKAFADAGFYTDENSLSFSFQDNNQTWQQQKEENGLRNFMGKVFENESENDNFAQAETAWDGKSALNIRV